MKKVTFKSGLIRTLPNITGLEELREKLYKSEFQEHKDQFIRSYSVSSKNGNHIKKLSQYITIKEDLKLAKIDKKIKKHGLKGFIIPTNLLGKALQNAPLPVSAQKQTLIESFSQMNNGKLNEAEGVHLIHSNSKKVFHPLAPNFCSQLISNLHFNKNSRLTLGESHLEHKTNKIAYGQAILQISHLTYHSLDLDLSSQTEPDLESKRLESDSVMLHEHCFSIPYSLKDKRYSPHGFIIHLNGKNITPDVINSIIGFKKNGFAGLAIVSGECRGKILSYQEEKKIFSNPNLKPFQKTTNNNLIEAIGNYIFDPSVESIKKGVLSVDKVGQVQNINGEITIVFYPLLQTFIAEYSE